MRLPTLAAIFLGLGALHLMAARESTHLNIKDAISPDGKYVLAAALDEKSACQVEVRAKDSGKALGRVAIPGYNPSDRDSSLAAVWAQDSSVCALNINFGHNSATCRIFAGNKNSWNELTLPKKPIDQVHQDSSRTGAKAQDLLAVEAWLPDHNVKVTYSGNSGAEYCLIFHLTRFGKTHLDHLQTYLPSQSRPDAPRISELPCTWRVFAGSTEGSADGPGATAQFKGPSGLAIGAAGDLIVADRINELLRRITPAAVVETLAGSEGESGPMDGVGKAARFWYPQGLAADAEGNIYVADTGGKRVRKVTPQGEVTTLASGFKYPTGVAVDRHGNVYVADASNNVIKKISPAGVVSTVAGKEGESGAKNGHAGSARFRFPTGVAVTADGTLFVVEHDAVRKIDPKGNVSTFAGSLEEEGRTDGAGASARFWGLTCLALDAKGNLYVADHEIRNLRRISPAGTVQTLRTRNHGDLPLQNPMALAVDAHGHIFVADQNTQTILLVEPVN